ncbi:MAG: Gfo/Idh/MocA family oxidoreductase, partial [Chloroflexi bacterium]|nr:Gfo/Idh/MocA family oxidoreductase [Chloroflexota bacterium]
MSIRVAIIGTGGIARANHLPGLRMLPGVEVTALCDTNEAGLQEVSRETGITATFTDYHVLLKEAALDAVVIATPTVLHHPAAMAAIAAGKHVLCEKQLGMNAAEAREMTAAAESAGVRNMTAFTYRFVPAMRYMKHRVDSGDIGQPYHLRVNRLQDFEHRDLGWRQVKKMAGTGELGDMLSHRLDFAHYLYGGMTRLVAGMKQFLPKRVDARGQAHASDVDDWVSI